MSSNSTTDEHLRFSEQELKLLDQPSPVEREVKLENLLATLEQPFDGDSPEAERDRALVALEAAGLLLDLDKKQEAHKLARSIVETLIAHGLFEDAALACQYVYLAEEFDAMPAIGQAAWLAITYPIDPHLTANILDHIIDETPDDSDGAAVAAAVAHYVVDFRSDEKEHEELRLFTGAMLARVAKRHSGITDQMAFDDWVSRMELDQPEKFLVRMRNVIDVLVQTDWWFDVEKLRSELPQD